MRRKVLIAPSTFAASDPAPLEKLERNGFKAVRNPYGRKLTREELVGLLDGVEGLIAGLETLDADVLRESRLKVISRCGAGMSNVDADAAKGRGIKVYSTPDAPTDAVAELTVGAMICLLRHIHIMNADLHGGLWSKRTGLQLEGKRIAIIGFGRIGRRVADLLKPFRARLSAVDPLYGGDVSGVEAVLPEKALEVADIITLHASGETTILGAKELASVKKGVYILNGSRGGLVNEGELCRALDDKRVAGAWLDSFAEEPYNGPLCRYPQVILTPHSGSYTKECRSRMEMEAVDNLIHGFGKE